MANNAGNLLTVKEVMTLLNVRSRSTLNNWAKKSPEEGGLVPQKFGRMSRYLPEDVNRFINRRPA